MLVVEATGLEKDALHIYVGVSVFLLCLLVFRRFRYQREIIALLVTTAMAMLGEFLDLRDNMLSLNHLDWAASLHDLLNTCFLPYVLFALIRWTTLLQPHR